MVPQCSSRITRVPWYSGTVLQSRSSFATRGCHPLWLRFPTDCARCSVSNSWTGLQPDHVRPYNPAGATPASLASPRFRLFPFRSPLLRESLLISITRVTKMFQFTHFSSPGLCIHPGMAEHYLRRVAPFGNLRINSYLPIPAAYRSLSRPSSSLRAKASSVRP